MSQLLLSLIAFSVHGQSNKSSTALTQAEQVVADSLKRLAYEAHHLMYKDPEAATHIVQSLFTGLDEIQQQRKTFHHNIAYFGNTILGHIANKRQDYSKADSLFRRAMDHAKSYQSRGYEGVAYFNLGVNFFLENRFTPALACYSQAIMIFDSLGKQNSLGNAYYGVAEIYFKQGDPEQAFEILDRSVHLFRKTGNNPGLIKSLAFAANLLSRYNFGEYKTTYREVALDYLKEGEALVDSLREGLADSDIPFVFYLNAGSFWAQQNNYSPYWNEPAGLNFERALQYYTLAQAHLNPIVSKAEHHLLLYNQADIYALLKENTRSLGLLNQACEIVEDTISTQTQMYVQGAYADLFQEQGDFPAALYHAKLKRLMQAEIQAEDMRLEVLRLEREIGVEQSKRRAVKAELEKRRTTYFLYTVAGLLLTGTIFVIFWVRNIRQKQRMREQTIRYEAEMGRQVLVEALQEQEIRTLNVAVDSQEAERKRIARELHDAVGGTMSALTVMSSAMEKRLRDQPEPVRNMFQRFYGVLDQTVKEVREISHSMAAKSLRQDSLYSAAKNLAETLQMSKQYEVALEIESLKQAPLSKEQEIHLYRILQEIIQNTVKHAEATHFAVRASLHGSHLTLETRDNGKGFVQHANQSLKGLGLSNIDARVKRLQGEWRVQTAPGEGVQFLIEIPLSFSTEDLATPASPSM